MIHYHIFISESDVDSSINNPKTVLQKASETVLPNARCGDFTKEAMCVY